MSTDPHPLERPLEGITVLDLTTALAGPYATFLLAGLGARVIKIENPAGPDTCRSNAPYLSADGPHLTRQHPDDISVSAINRLRNKQAVTLNLKHPGSRAVFEKLVAKADMLVENFARGVLDRLGAGYADVHRMNPRLLYCSITGFGSQGEGGSGKAMDAIIQALSGAMMTSGSAGDPPVRMGVPFADLCTPLFGVIGLLAALHQSQRTGMGQHVDVSMLGVMTSLVACEPFDLLEQLRGPSANRTNGASARAVRRVSYGRWLRGDLRAHGYIRRGFLLRHWAAGTEPGRSVSNPRRQSGQRNRSRSDRYRVHACAPDVRGRGDSVPGGGAGRRGSKSSRGGARCSSRLPGEKPFVFSMPPHRRLRCTVRACRSSFPVRPWASTRLPPALENTTRKSTGACWATRRTRLRRFNPPG